MVSGSRCLYESDNFIVGRVEMSIRVAIVGVGNCASSLVQCVEADIRGELNSGVSHPRVGKYEIKDIEFVAAFDVDARKVGKELSEGILAVPNCTSLRAEVNKGKVIISRGALLDGVCAEMRGTVDVSSLCEDVSMEEVVNTLKTARAELVVSYLPVGSQQASEFYAEAASQAGAGFINCTPACIAHSSRFVSLFRSAGLVLLGDDIKSQFGSTAIHRALVNLLQLKGLKVTKTHQLNIGGNSDFQNMRCGDRGAQKKFTKENSIRTLLTSEAGLSIGPSDYVPALADYKIGYFSIQGEGILGMPFKLDMKIEVEDSPNSAGVVVNAIRIAKVAQERNMSGPIVEVCPYLFKNPPSVTSESDSISCFDKFLNRASNA